MILTGAPHEILAQVNALNSKAEGIIKAARAMVSRGRQDVEDFQAAALAMLAAPYDVGGAHVLEIGTYYGYTAAVLGLAAPMAHVVTLNTLQHEVIAAQKNLRQLPNVKPLCVASWDYLKEYNGPALDMIFVDGDHKRIALDLPWFDWLRPGGLMVFHDYTPLGAPRHCPPVFEALNAAVERIDRGFDVLIVDNQQIGMAGWYKRNTKEHLIHYPREIEE